MIDNQLILPSLKKTHKFKKTKNEIVHLLQKERIVNNCILDYTESNLRIKKGKDEILITENQSLSINGENKILFTKKLENLKDKTDLRGITKWLSHPLNKTFSPNQVAKSWKNKTSIIEEDLSKGAEGKGLREPQAGAIYSTLGHWRSSDNLGTIVLPTGTGKTETMLTLLIKCQCEKLLVIVPSQVLRKQISNKFISLGILKQLKVLSNDVLNPIVGIFRQNFNTDEDLKEFINKCNVIVGTASLLAKSTESQQGIMANLFSHLFIDEAHHVMAPSWYNFRNRFAPKKVLQFTATPYRNDGIRMDGKIVFNFPLRKAQEQGYFKKIDFIPVKKYDKREADKEIAKVAIAKLRDDLSNGYTHVLLARCDTTDRADKIFELYKKEVDLKPVCIHNKVSKRKEKEKLLVSGEAKIVVCVDMFGEGFDLPELKIAAFHDVRKSPSRYYSIRWEVYSKQQR